MKTGKPPAPTTGAGYLRVDDKWQDKYFEKKRPPGALEYFLKGT